MVATGLVSGMSFIPGFWRHGDSRIMSAALRRRFGAASVFDFPYDWRRSIAASATALGAAIRRVLESRPPGTRVVLVGHSMGGLVARRYVACEGGAEHGSLLIALGTPFRGAVQALEALAHGILPPYDCFVHVDGRRSGIAAARPPAVVSTGLYAAAAAVHAEVGAAIAQLGPLMPPTLAIVGQHQWTPTFARLRSDGDFALLESSGWKGDDFHRSHGDGTVPRGSAQLPEWGDDPTRAHVVVGRHVDLPCIPEMDAVLGAALVGRRYLGLAHDPEAGLAIELPELVGAGEPVEVRASHPDDGLALELSVTDIHDGEVVAHAALANLGGGSYRQVLTRLGSGQYSVAVSGLAEGRPQRVSDLVIVLPE
ncbi:MAG: hypothetical protein ABIP03_13485 [Aquihabitans sp.]